MMDLQSTYQKTPTAFGLPIQNRQGIMCLHIKHMNEDTAMQNKRKHSLRKLFVTDEAYHSVLDAVCKNNRNVILILCSACSAIFASLITLGLFHIAVDAEDLPIFLFAFLYTLGVLLLVTISGRQNDKVVTSAMYLIITAVMFYGLLVSYRSPDQYTVTFIAMMGIMSMTFVDKPARMCIVNGIFTLICVGMIALHKDESLRAADIINVSSFSLLSIIGGLLTMNMKIHTCVMDKLYEADIERGKQRLNEKEIEALQLFTAVKATHDMIVSVNLTQNSYKLLGDRSFITVGDVITGVFDEVINVHANKVIDEHRDLYYSTFSRQGLLKAYAEGKKEVYLEYQQRDDSGVPHWLGTHTMFIDNPHSSDVMEITISQNIDERVLKEEALKASLQEQRDRAEQAQQAKTDFLFQMSHDIRTPMNAIIGFANFIKTSNDLDAIHSNYVVKLEMASQQLLMLINEALEMSRIESGKLVFHQEMLDLRSVITNVLTVVQIQISEKDLDISADIDVVHPVVSCDRNHMNRVMMNLLSNAVKFTPTGGRITVSLHEKPEAPEGYSAFELKVADTGIGMSPEFLKKVFDPFEREQTSTVSGIQGTGLGLSIVKRIVESSGNTISVESTQGVGTVFTIDLTLPRGDASEAIAGSDAAVPTVEQMAEYFRNKRILLVEDNEFNLTIAQILLENAGFLVETAADGQVAVNKVINAPADHYYDAILMDIQMPHMNGYEATRIIRALPNARSGIKIIAVTANAFETDRTAAIEAGMDEHISKPIDVNLLYRVLREVL